jgi:hypothetical protein
MAVRNAFMPSRAISFTLPVQVQTASGWKVSSTISVDDRQYHVWFHANRGPLADGVDTFLAVCIVPAMMLGYEVHAPAPASKRLIQGIAQFQQIMTGWYPELKLVSIAAEAREDTPVIALGVGSFFSCGVDATYTMLKHHEQITDGVLILGFDFHRAHSSSCALISRIARQATQQLHRGLIEVETNIRDFGDQFGRMGAVYHGSLLGSVALLLSPLFSTMYIPSSFAEADLFPWGSHPAIDPLWSSEAVDIHHDGCEASRVQKVALTAQHPTALNHLRVCWNTFTTRNQSINCGSCDKCLRTMIDLRIAGALERCPTFNTPLNLSDVRRLDIRRGVHRLFFQSSLNELRRTGHDPELAEALEECLSLRHYRGWEGLCRDAYQNHKALVRPLLRPFERTARWMSKPFQRRLPSLSDRS